MLMRARVLLCLVVALGLSDRAGLALAQPPARGDAAGAAAAGVVLKVPIEKALEQSRAQQKLLVAVASESASALRMNLAPWNEPGLAAWAKAHAVVVVLDDRGVLRSLGEDGARVGGPEQPLVFRDGLQVPLIGTNRGANTTRLRPVPAQAAGSGERHANTALRLMLRLEFTRRGLAARNEAWAKAQAKPAPPAPTDFHTRASEGVPAFAEIEPPEGAKAEDVFARYAQARAAFDAGDDARAAALMTWLWERGSSVEPMSGPAVRTLLPISMRALAVRSPAARARFSAMAEAGLPTLWARDSQGLFEWLMLARVAWGAGRDLVVLDLLDAMLSDVGADAEMAPADRLDLELMLPRVAPVDPLTLPGMGGGGPAPVRFVKREIGQLSAKPLPRVSAEQWSQAMKFRGVFMLTEACRLHAALLAAGREADAKAILEPLKVIAPEGRAERWLEATARLAGVQRPFHVEWLAAGK